MTDTAPMLVAMLVPAQPHCFLNPCAGKIKKVNKNKHLLIPPVVGSVIQCPALYQFHPS